MFDHDNFDRYEFETVPLNRDIYLMDVRWMPDYEAQFLKFFSDGKQFDPVGYIAYAAAHSIGPNAIELSWYPNTFTRFHEVRVSMPRSKFVRCVGSWRCDEKPRIFVESNWLQQLYTRTHSVFALVDAVGVKAAIADERLSRELLLALRDGIDEIAARHTELSFVSFADSLLLKSNWHTANFETGATDNYKPETVIYVIREIDALYKRIAGLSVYAILCQGSNEWYNDALLHISQPHQNHISLNSLGLPFAQLSAIEKQARRAIRRGSHAPAELYLDQHFYNSLNFKFSFEKNDECDRADYTNPMTEDDGIYRLASINQIIENLKE